MSSFLGIWWSNRVATAQEKQEIQTFIFPEGKCVEFAENDQNMFFTQEIISNTGRIEELLFRKQVWIPVGCVPLACRPYRRGGSAQPGGSASGGGGLGGPPRPPWTEWLTDRCKDITLPQDAATYSIWNEWLQRQPYAAFSSCEILIFGNFTN